VLSVGFRAWSPSFAMLGLGRGKIRSRRSRWSFQLYPWGSYGSALPQGRETDYIRESQEPLLSLPAH
jgi:hypothetical protein